LILKDYFQQVGDAFIDRNNVFQISGAPVNAGFAQNILYFLTFRVDDVAESHLLHRNGR